MTALQEIVLSAEELEAVRWADLQGCYHALAAEHMGISRATFGRILESGRKKIARALVEGHALCLTSVLVSLQSDVSPNSFQECKK
jgi:predicted DNA-binding protein (UPF0251 family)